MPRERPATLPAAVQLGIVAVMAVGLMLALVAAPAALRAAASQPAPAARAPPPGTFLATPEQWRGLTFAPATFVSFADTVSTEGKIGADDDLTVQVTSPVSGRVATAPVRAGDRVVRGQTLLTADATEVAQARNDLAAAEAALTSARAQQATAQANATRQQALYSISGSALKDVQQAATDAITASGAVRADAAALALVKARLAVLQAGPGSGGRVAVRAPITGVVMARQVGPGQYLNATSNGSTTPIFTLSDTSKVWLVAQAPEADAERLHLGARLAVRVADLPGRVFRAALDYVAPSLDPVTRRLAVHAVIANPDGALKPEMFADFILDAGPARRSVAVPASAVIHEGDSARVWVAEPGHALGLRQIKVGRTQGGDVEVLDGLKPGEPVATSGAIFIDRAAKAD